MCYREMRLSLPKLRPMQPLRIMQYIWHDVRHLVRHHVNFWLYGLYEVFSVIKCVWEYYRAIGYGFFIQEQLAVQLLWVKAIDVVAIIRPRTTYTGFPPQALDITIM